MAATPCSSLDAADSRLLLEIAASAIEGRLESATGGAPPDLGTLPISLTRYAACFVSLQTRTGLRGCCGTLEASRPLAIEARHNAWASAFADPRFPPLQVHEWPGVSRLEISVLSTLEPMVTASEAQLQDALVPHVDGVVLAWGGQRATFLPKVWDQIGDVREFLQHLKIKAGWSAQFWARDMVVLRYSTTEASIEWPAGRSRGSPRSKLSLP
jgi:AmmeMemoRadiSam system protein A